jgi:hypothetical protein
MLCLVAAIPLVLYADLNNLPRIVWHRPLERSSVQQIEVNRLLGVVEKVTRWDDQAKAKVEAQQKARLEEEKQAKLALRKAIPELIADIKKRHPNLEDREMTVLGGKLVPGPTFGSQIRQSWNRFLGEDRTDPINRFFRVGIAN